MPCWCGVHQSGVVGWVKSSGLTSDAPAESCEFIRKAKGKTGYYYLKLSPKVKTYCNMDVQGGGWEREYRRPQRVLVLHTLFVPSVTVILAVTKC